MMAEGKGKQSSRPHGGDGDNAYLYVVIQEAFADIPLQRIETQGTSWNDSEAAGGCEDNFTAVHTGSARTKRSRIDKEKGFGTDCSSGRRGASQV